MVLLFDIMLLLYFKLVLLISYDTLLPTEFLL